MNEEKTALNVWNWTQSQRNKPGRSLKKSISNILIEMRSSDCGKGIGTIKNMASGMREAIKLKLENSLCSTAEQ